jgi:hypothetical protein
MFRKAALAIGALLASAAMVFAGMAPAQAVGGGCRLDSSTWVTTSANWSGNQLQYVVANSPEPLLIAGSHRTYATYVVGSSGRTTNLYYSRGSWIYRGDIYQNTGSVTLVIYDGAGNRCTATMYR